GVACGSMSFIATFHVLPQLDVPHDSGADIHEVLSRAARQLEDEYGWGGLCVISLFDYLDEASALDVDVRPYLGDGVAYVLPFELRAQRAMFDPAHFTPEQLVDAMGMLEDGDGFDAEEAAYAATDTLNAVRSGLGELEPGQVLVITVG